MLAGLDGNDGPAYGGPLGGAHLLGGLLGGLLGLGGGLVLGCGNLAFLAPGGAGCFGFSGHGYKGGGGV